MRNAAHKARARAAAMAMGALLDTLELLLPSPRSSHPPFSISAFSAAPFDCLSLSLSLPCAVCIPSLARVVPKLIPWNNWTSGNEPRTQLGQTGVGCPCPVARASPSNKYPAGCQSIETAFLKCGVEEREAKLKIDIMSQPECKKTNVSIIFIKLCPFQVLQSAEKACTR